MAISEQYIPQEHFSDRRCDPDVALLREFKGPEGLVLHSPKDDRGYVTSIEKMLPISMAFNRLPEDVTVHEIRVHDPYIEADPKIYKQVTKYVEHMEDILRKRGISPFGKRTEANSPEEYNEFTKAWVNDATVDGVKMWRDLVPTALALDYLINPVLGREIQNRSGNIAILSPESAAQMRFVADAVAIRDRAIAMQKIIETHVSEVTMPGEPVSWLSLASGTAEPAIAAARAIQNEVGITVDLTVADINKRALALIEKVADKYDFKDHVHSIWANILTPNLSAHLAIRTENPNQQYDVVENMGFEEYLPQDGDELGARRDLDLPQASEFTREAFELVKPGGALISGNMVLDRPQAGYVFNIVDWPLINARSEESILNVYKQAGILDNPDAKVELFRVRNNMSGIHIYDIVKVTKLLTAV